MVMAREGKYTFNMCMNFDSYILWKVYVVCVRSTFTLLAGRKFSENLFTCQRKRWQKTNYCVYFLSTYVQFENKKVFKIMSACLFIYLTKDGQVNELIDVLLCNENIVLLPTWKFSRKTNIIVVIPHICRGAVTTNNRQ